MRPHSYFLGTGNGKMAGNVGKGDKEEDRKLSGTPDKLGRNTIFFSLCPGFILWQLWSFKVISSRLKMALFQSLFDKKKQKGSMIFLLRVNVSDGISEIIFCRFGAKARRDAELTSSLVIRFFLGKIFQTGLDHCSLLESLSLVWWKERRTAWVVASSYVVYHIFLFRIGNPFMVSLARSQSMFIL